MRWCEDMAVAGGRSAIHYLVRTCILLILAAGAAICLLPFLWMLSTSLRTSTQVMAIPIQWIPKPFVLDGYLTAWSRMEFSRYVVNTAVVSMSVTLLTVLTCSLAGYAFAKKRFFGKEIVFTLLIGTMTIPGLVLMIPLFIIIMRLRMLDKLIGLIIPFASNVFGIYLMRQYISSIPTELEEAARIDGCSEWRLFWQVILPLAKPAVAVLAIFTFQGNWNAFTMPLVIINSRSKFTLALALAQLQLELVAGEAAAWNVLMAASTLMLLPIIVIFLSLQRYFVKGLAGAIKG